MSFLVLLLVVLVEKFSHWRVRLQRDRWCFGWLDFLGGLPALRARPWLGLLLALLVPLLLLALLLGRLESFAYGLFALPVHLLVLLWSLGRGDIQQAIGPFRDAWRREDLQGAFRVAERDLGVRADDQDELLANVQGTLVWQGYQAFFAVIFWYALLGPLAALAYRLSAIMAGQEQGFLREGAARLRHVLDWLPTRALVLSFALVGNFIAVTRSLLVDLLALNVSAARLLARAAYAAEGFSESALGAAGVASLDALWQLLVRAAVFWYALFAVRALFF